MTIFRWALGGLAALLALGTVLAIVIGLIAASDVWYDRARRFGQWLWMLALLWFNLEVWGRVVWTMLHWSS